MIHKASGLQIPAAPLTHLNWVNIWKSVFAVHNLPWPDGLKLLAAKLEKCMPDQTLYLHINKLFVLLGAGGKTKVRSVY